MFSRLGEGRDRRTARPKAVFGLSGRRPGLILPQHPQCGVHLELGRMQRDSRTDAWILYAVDIAAGRAPASRTDISTAADAISHAVPTHNELNGSLAWLRDQGLVESQGKFHRLSERGRRLVAQARSGASAVSSVWANLAAALSRGSAEA
jgi:hypothetical protein